MSLKHGLLGLLSFEGPTTGYDLDKFFKNSLGNFWHAKTSHIYRELRAMEEQGWLASERIVQEEKPNKRVYSITNEGKTELLSWLSSSDAGLGSRLKSVFMMKMFFSGELGKEAALKLVREFREVIAARIPMLAQARKEIAQDETKYPKHAPYWKLTLLNGEIGTKAALEWADKAIEILENIAEEKSE